MDDAAADEAACHRFYGADLTDMAAATKVLRRDICRIFRAGELVEYAAG